MARTDKPYRVYRGGRVRGGVPLRTKPARPEAKDGEDRYRGPSKPAREGTRWSWGRRIGVALVVLIVLFVVWSIAVPSPSFASRTSRWASTAGPNCFCAAVVAA